MVELRKRPAPPAAPPPAKKKSGPKSSASAQAPKESKPAPVKDAKPAAKNGDQSATGAPKVDDNIDLAEFGGEVETNDGETTTLAKLVQASAAGVVLFTYPKASTPGCTTQACLFRDSYAPLTSTGLQIYGLSNDSPKANTTFKTKQNLPYPLLCDPKQSLIGAIGMKKKPSGTTRGVFVVDKNGKVLAAEPGGPAATVEVVKALVEKVGKVEKEEAVEDTKQKADTAAEVADSAADLDKAEA